MKQNYVKESYIARLKIKQERERQRRGGGKYHPLENKWTRKRRERNWETVFRNEAARFVHEEVRSKALGNDSPDEGSTSSILDVKNFSNPYRSQNWVERGERDTKVPLRKERKKIYFREKCFGFRKNGIPSSSKDEDGVEYRYQVSQPWRKKVGEGGGGWIRLGREWRAKGTRGRKRRRRTRPRGGTDERTQQGMPSCLRSDTPGLPAKEEKRVPPFHHE